MKVYLLLSSAVLFIHFSFIIFVITGFLYISAGALFKIASARNRKFRYLHLASVVYVTLQAWLGKLCPLTYLEFFLREEGGGERYTGTFMEYWVGKLIYYDFPFSCFIFAYTIFLILVILLMIIYSPGKK
jgi:hypothetical protein